MAIRRIFIDWQTPLLPAVVDWLEAKQTRGGTFDLDNLIVALPTGHACQRLLELLVERAEQKGLTLLPPLIKTAGVLPELLYEAKRPLADEFTQQLAWVRALERVDRDRLQSVFPTLPEASDFWAWLALGQTLSRLHTELAAETLDFNHVVERGLKIDNFNEVERWGVLVEVQQTYLKILDELGLWDKQTARLVAIERGEFHTDRQIVLVGTVDMNRAQRKILDAVAEHVTAIVGAPEELAARFDEHGCLELESWQDVPLGLKTEQIDVVDGPGDQADAVVRALAALGGKYAADEITVSVADTTLVPLVKQRLAECNIRSRYQAGQPVSSTGPYQLPRVVAEYLETREFANFAAIMRHPAITRWLAAQEIRDDVLTAVDDYYQRHLPSRMGGSWPPACKPDHLVRRVYAELEKLLTPLQGKARPLGEWGQPILNMVTKVYGHEPIHTDDEAGRVIVAACDELRKVLATYLELGPAVMPKVEGAQALRLALDHVRQEQIPQLANADEIELMGWLDLPLDDAPAAVVAGFNEGIVPASLNGDLFLPNELRRLLRLNDNDRRYARDAYALSVVAASRQQLKIIAGRRSGDNDPLVPSRLLLAGDDETLAKRTLVFFADRKEARHRIVLPGGLKPGRSKSGLFVPTPQPPAEPVTQMRVTEFRDYLACPYRYYLRHRLKLVDLEDSADELDERQFGNLVHAAVKAFGRSEHRESSDAELITAQLNAAVDALVAEEYGQEPAPAVRVQAEQARQRLALFAQWQAEVAGQGWRILHTEVDPPKGKACLDIDGESMILLGRIDRIDRHVETGQFRVLDYKTGDAGKTPEQVHRSRSGEWLDLQLPLYRHLTRPLQVAGSIELGYIALARDHCEYAPAHWTSAELEQADEVARDIVRKVRAGDFQSLTQPPPKFFEAYAAICQDRQFGPKIFAGAEEHQ